MNQITILLAEDSFGDQKLFKMAIEDSVETQLKIVADGSEAVQFLRREGTHAEAPRPDLVVLDLNLPKVSGSEILEIMKKDPTLARIPVVIFSGANPTDALLYVCKHASLYIVKPDGGDEYFIVVKSLEQYCRNLLRFPESTSRHAQELRRSLMESHHCMAYVPGASEQPLPGSPPADGRIPIPTHSLRRLG